MTKDRSGQVEDGFSTRSSPQSSEPDSALIYYGYLFETLRQAPECNDPMLDALARLIVLEQPPKTLLGFAVIASAEKWLRRHLWMTEFKRLPASDQAICVVIDSAMLMRSA